MPFIGTVRRSAPVPASSSTSSLVALNESGRYAVNSSTSPSGDQPVDSAAARHWSVRSPKNIFGGRRVTNSCWFEPSRFAVTTVIPFAGSSECTNAIVWPFGDQPMALTTWLSNWRGGPPGAMVNRHTSGTCPLPSTATRSTKFPSGVTVMLEMRLNVSGGTRTTSVPPAICRTKTPRPALT